MRLPAAPLPFTVGFLGRFRRDSGLDRTATLSRPRLEWEEGAHGPTSPGKNEGNLPYLHDSHLVTAHQTATVVNNFPALTTQGDITPPLPASESVSVCPGGPACSANKRNDRPSPKSRRFQKHGAGKSRRTKRYRVVDKEDMRRGNAGSLVPRPLVVSRGALRRVWEGLSRFRVARVA